MILDLIRYLFAPLANTERRKATGVLRGQSPLKGKAPPEKEPAFGSEPEATGVEQALQSARLRTGRAGYLRAERTNTERRKAAGVLRGQSPLKGKAPPEKEPAFGSEPEATGPPVGRRWRGSPPPGATRGEKRQRKTPAERSEFWRCLAESNRCTRFCRPVPNHSAKAPNLWGMQR